MRAPEAYVDWINKHLGFNPRSQSNSNALADFVIADLQDSCPALAHDLQPDSLRIAKNADVRTRVACRNVDLVLVEAGADLIRLAVENKTIMTAHGKARLNRYGDLIAYCNHVHNHRADCIAGAIIVVNCSPAYENPDAFARGLLRPKLDMSKVVKDTVKIFAEVPLRNTPEDPNELPEALAAVILDYDGQHQSKLVTGDLSPSQDSPIHYESFIKRICELYQKRFGA